MTEHKKAIRAVLALPVACTVCTGCGQDASEADGQEDRKPLNIIYIMSDDHSYQTIGAYGHGLIETPNIDRLADSGMIFTQSFVANSISGPSRACLLTGKHSHKNGFTDNTRTFDGSQQTFPKLLRQAGYETAVIGKWHLTSAPTGFDYWNILIGQGQYYNPTFIDNGERRVIPGYATDITTDLALDWLENKRDPEKPFCLLLHHKAPHRTWMPDLQDLGAFDDAELPLPENFYDEYEGRPAAAAQEMEIDRYKLIHFYGHDIDSWELSDLEKDPTEMHNLYGDRSYRRVQKKLHRELLRLQELYDDPVEQELAQGIQ